MPSIYVTTSGSVEDFDGMAMSIGTDCDLITIGGHRFPLDSLLAGIVPLLAKASLDALTWQASHEEEEEHGSDCPCPDCSAIRAEDAPGEAYGA